MHPLIKKIGGRFSVSKDTLWYSVGPVRASIRLYSIPGGGLGVDMDDVSFARIRMGFARKKARQFILKKMHGILPPAITAGETPDKNIWFRMKGVYVDKAMISGGKVRLVVHLVK